MSATADSACGSCTLCCKLLGVPEVPTPPGEWCGHCEVGRGCRIYREPERPEQCREFECLWLQSQSRLVSAFSPELKPSVSRVVLSATKDGGAIVAHVDPDRPEAYRTGAMGRFLRSRSADVAVFAVIGETRLALGAKAQAALASAQAERRKEKGS